MKRYTGTLIQSGADKRFVLPEEDLPRLAAQAVGMPVLHAFDRTHPVGIVRNANVRDGGISIEVDLVDEEPRQWPGPFCFVAGGVVDASRVLTRLDSVATSDQPIPPDHPRARAS